MLRINCQSIQSFEINNPIKKNTISLKSKVVAENATWVNKKEQPHIKNLSLSNVTMCIRSCFMFCCHIYLNTGGSQIKSTTF